METRPLQPADRTQAERLVCALFPDADPRAELDRYLSAGEWPAVFVAQRPDGPLVGFIEVGTRPYAEGCETSPVAFVEAWYVDPAARRQGIGRQLFAAAEDYARAHGLTEIASDTQLDNQISIEAHKALGYQEVERLVCFMRRLT